MTYPRPSAPPRGTNDGTEDATDLYEWGCQEFSPLAQEALRAARRAIRDEGRLVTMTEILDRMPVETHYRGNGRTRENRDVVKRLVFLNMLSMDWLADGTPVYSIGEAVPHE